MTSVRRPLVRLLKFFTFNVTALLVGSAGIVLFLLSYFPMPLITPLASYAAAQTAAGAKSSA